MMFSPIDSFYRERTPDLSKIDYPALVIANWGGLGLRLRGTIRGYMRIASREKWPKGGALDVGRGSLIEDITQGGHVSVVATL